MCSSGASSENLFLVEKQERRYRRPQGRSIGWRRNRSAAQCPSERHIQRIGLQFCPRFALVVPPGTSVGSATGGSATESKGIGEYAEPQSAGQTTIGRPSRPRLVSHIESRIRCKSMCLSIDVLEPEDGVVDHSTAEKTKIRFFARYQKIGFYFFCHAPCKRRFDWLLSLPNHSDHWLNYRGFDK